jgi:hypothetical protein
MARARKQDGTRRCGISGRDLGELGRCGECQTRRRPVGRYAYTVRDDLWLCDRCFIRMCFGGIWLLPWKEGEPERGAPDAGYLNPPKEPALHPRPVSGEDRAEAAPALTSPAGWEEEDDEDDRRLRLSELRRVGFAMLALFQDSATPDDERRGLLRAMKVLKERTLELRG